MNCKVGVHLRVHFRMLLQMLTLSSLGSLTFVLLEKNKMNIQRSP